MDAVYSLASGQDGGRCLVEPVELLAKIPYKVDFRESDLEPTLNQLMLENYFSYEKAKKLNGDTMFIITLKDNGISYLRDRQVSRRKLAIKILIAIVVAAISFSFKSILNAIFG